MWLYGVKVSGSMPLPKSKICWLRLPPAPFQVTQASNEQLPVNIERMPAPKPNPRSTYWFVPSRTTLPPEIVAPFIKTPSTSARLTDSDASLVNAYRATISARAEGAVADTPAQQSIITV